MSHWRYPPTAYLGAGAEGCLDVTVLGIWK